MTENKDIASMIPQDLEVEEALLSLYQDTWNLIKVESKSNFLQYILLSVLHSVLPA